MVYQQDPPEPQDQQSTPQPPVAPPPAPETQQAAPPPPLEGLPPAPPPPADPQLSAQPTTAPGTEARTWAMLCHLLGVIGILGPLIAWLVKKDSIPEVDAYGKEALNFQLTVLMAVIALNIVGAFTCGVGSILAMVVGIAGLVFAIIAAMKANTGEFYTYPFALRLIK